jgi:hypothetical protein
MFSKKAFSVIVYLAAAFGCAVFAFFMLHAVGVFNESGGVDPRADLFLLTRDQLQDASSSISQTGTIVTVSNSRIATCMLEKLNSKYPETAARIYAQIETSGNYKLAYPMLLATQTVDPQLISDYATCKTASDEIVSNNGEVYQWMKSEEWNVLRTALTRDADAIKRASEATGIPPRILIGPIIGEQLRYYTSARAVFKSYLQPTSSFIHLSKFSFGIAGMKPETAERVENNLKDPKSVWYPGPQYENLLDYPEGTVDIPAERMKRLTDSKDHYYAYLYVGMYLQQFTAQWNAAGYDISTRPEVLSTLYNLGHNRSIPKPQSRAGGAVIAIDGKEYTFGGLAYDFYWSGQLQDLFPY